MLNNTVTFNDGIANTNFITHSLKWNRIAVWGPHEILPKSPTCELKQ